MYDVQTLKTFENGSFCAFDEENIHAVMPFMDMFPNTTTTVFQSKQIVHKTRQMEKACDDSSVHYGGLRRRGGGWLRHVGAASLFLYGLMLLVILACNNNNNDGRVLFVQAFQVTTPTAPSWTRQALQHKLSPMVSPIISGEGQKVWMLSAKTTGDDGDDNDNDQQQQSRAEIEQLQKELDAITSPPPKNDPLTNNDNPAMIGSFDADSFDETKIPIPLFTGVIVLILSVAVTFELYNIGLNGFPEPTTTTTTTTSTSSVVIPSSLYM